MGNKARIILASIVVVAVMVGSAVITDWHVPLPDGIPEGEHWSLFVQLFPGLLHNIGALIQQHPSFIQHTPPDRVSHILSATLVFVIAGILAVLAGRRLRNGFPLVPDAKLSPLTLFEIIAEAAFSLMEGLMGEEAAAKHFPIIGALAVFILFSNLLGMVPGLVPPTDTLNTTAALALPVFLATHYYGIRQHGLSYFKQFLGPIRKWYALPLMTLMAAIEIISHFVRPLSLSVRLMGNIMGDHKVLTIFLGFGILFIPLPIMVLGIVVAIVQTLVFCLLAMVYFALAIEHE